MMSARPRNREETLLVPDLAGAAAGGADDRLAPRRRTHALACFAGLAARNLNRRLGAARRLLERDLEVVAQVGAAAAATAPAASTEDVAESEDVAQAAEDVLEAGEDGRVEAGRRGAAKPGVPEAIVHVPLVAVGEHGIRLGRFLEALFRRLVPGVPVGMELQRQFAVRALDLLFGRRALDLEHFVIIAFAHGRLATFTMAGRSSRSPIR
jgi:hypothetical protein